MKIAIILLLLTLIATIGVLKPYIADMIAQIKYDLKISYYSPKYTKKVWPNNSNPSHGKPKHDNGSKW